MTQPSSPSPSPKSEAIPEISSRQVLSFVLKMVRPYPAAIFVMFLIAFAWAIDLSLRPYLLKLMLNSAAEPDVENIFTKVAFPAVFYLAICFAMSTLYRVYGYFVEINMIPKLRTRIANANFGKLLGQGHPFYQNNFSGGLATKITDLVSSTPDIIQIVLDRFLSHALALIVAVYTLWLVNVSFAIAMISWSVLFLGVSLFLTKRLSQQAAEWSSCGSRITGKMVDVLSNSLSVRLFSRRKAEKDYLDVAFQEATEAEQKLQWTYFWIWFCYGYSFDIMLGVNLFLLIKGLQDGWVTLGDFALVLTINITIADFLWQLTREFSQFSKLLGRMTQALQTILAPYEMEDAEDARPLIVPQGKITFDQVQFKYKGTEPLFKNKSIIIEPGQKVGLVGYSGSGKSTFVNLILRLYDVTSGKILIDGQDIRGVTQDSLRSAIGMIPQDPSLFHRSLIENIRYGNPHASDSEVKEAARKAYAHDFIMTLPEKYEALVGERGVKLSGGQRQRIAIARAILKNAPILILDEATSQLDSVTEGQIQDSLWELMQGKTTLIIAHRLSTLLQMDRILVFDRGKIVEDGSHKDLLAKDGLYKTLWEAQVGGFLPEVR